MKLSDLPTNPIKDTDEERQYRIDSIFAYLETPVTVESACKRCGVTYRSFRRWINKDPALLARWESVEIDRHNQVEEVCKLAALKALEDPRYQTSMIFYLKCKAGWNDGSGWSNPNAEMPSVTFEKEKTESHE